MQKLKSAKLFVLCPSPWTDKLPPKPLLSQVDPNLPSFILTLRLADLAHSTLSSIQGRSHVTSSAVPGARENRTRPMLPVEVEFRLLRRNSLPWYTRSHWLPWSGGGIGFCQGKRQDVEKSNAIQAHIVTKCCRMPVQDNTSHTESLVCVPYLFYNPCPVPGKCPPTINKHEKHSSRQLQCKVTLMHIYSFNQNQTSISIRS